MKRHARIKRLEGIWQQFLVASSAMVLLEVKLANDPAFGSPHGWSRRDASQWRSSLEGTFLVRMYAEFEMNLRDAWKNRYKQKTQPPMKDLLISLAAQTRISDDWRDETDLVQLYRNSLIHPARNEAIIVPLEIAKSRLIRFLSRLPLDW